MNRLKPYFISPFLIGSIGIALFSAIRFFGDVTQLNWLVTMVSSWSICLYFVYLYTRYPREVQFSILILTVVCLLAPIICLADFKFNDNPDFTPFYLSLFCALGWLGYDRWYSRMPSPSSFEVLLGTVAPKLTLEGEAGKVSTLDFKNGKYDIVFFHRGAWCPFCVAQLREAKAFLKEAEELDSRIHMISNKRSVQFDLEKNMFSGVSAEWADPEQQASRQLGISHKRGVPLGLEIFGFESNTTLPATLIIDPQGIIIYNKVVADYRKRPSLNFFFRLIKGHKSGEFTLSQHAKS